MLVLRDRASIAQLQDPELRSLIEQRVVSLVEFDDYDLDQLVTFLVVEPCDSLEAIDDQLGFQILAGTPELLEEHSRWYEIVFVLSDDGYGIEVFIPKHPGVDPLLLAMCSTHVQEVHDS